MGFSESAAKLEQAVNADPASADLGISELVSTAFVLNTKYPHLTASTTTFKVDMALSKFWEADT